MPTVRIGLDVSVNSTGLTIALIDETEFETVEVTNKKGKTITHLINKIQQIEFHRIVSGDEKNKKTSNSIQLHTYDRIAHTDMGYSYEDISKIESAKRLSNKIEELLRKFFITHTLRDVFVEARIEGSVMSFGFKARQSRVNDLTAFNSIVKHKLLEISNSIESIAPKTLKLLATEDGSAKKHVLEQEFLKQYPDFDTTGKLDDIIDSYFLATIDTGELPYITTNDVF